MMNEVQKPSDPKYNIQSSEPFRIYLNFELLEDVKNYSEHNHTIRGILLCYKV
jgi:hypothetical protein